jgi:hypothetical protein
MDTDQFQLLNPSSSGTYVTVVTVNTSRWPKGTIPSESRAPFVSSTLPNFPLFAVPLAGTVKVANA